MTKAEVTAVIQAELKGLSTEFEVVDYTNAINAAERDTGWSEPYGGNFKETWILQRTKRHLFSYLQTETAGDFRYKQINLQQVFEHHTKIIDSMDKAFKEIMEEEPHQFAGVEAYELFGHKVDAGFATETQTGRDMTYGEDQRVIVTPNENS